MVVSDLEEEAFSLRPSRWYSARICCWLRGWRCGSEKGAEMHYKKKKERKKEKG